jgi:hypothetical protein
MWSRVAWSGEETVGRLIGGLVNHETINLSLVIPFIALEGMDRRISEDALSRLRRHSNGRTACPPNLFETFRESVGAHTNLFTLGVCQPLPDNRFLKGPCPKRILRHESEALRFLSTSTVYSICVENHMRC